MGELSVAFYKRTRNGRNRSLCNVEKKRIEECEQVQQQTRDDLLGYSGRTVS